MVLALNLHGQDTINNLYIDMDGQFSIRVINPFRGTTTFREGFSIGLNTGLLLIPKDNAGFGIRITYSAYAPGIAYARLPDNTFGSLEEIPAKRIGLLLQFKIGERQFIKGDSSSYRYLCIHWGSSYDIGRTKALRKYPHLIENIDSYYNDTRVAMGIIAGTTLPLGRGFQIGFQLDASLTGPYFNESNIFGPVVGDVELHLGLGMSISTWP